MLAAGVISGTGLSIAFLRDEPLPLPARGVRKALKPLLVASDFCADVAASNSGELDETRGIIAAETIAKVLIESTNNNLNVGFELATEKSECNLFRRRCMISSPIIQLGGVREPRVKLRFEVVLKGIPAKTLTLYLETLRNS